MGQEFHGPRLVVRFSRLTNTCPPLIILSNVSLPDICTEKLDIYFRAHGFGYSCQTDTDEDSKDQIVHAKTR